jgi:bifunctional non-homologous end joining protein LigD
VVVVPNFLPMLASSGPLPVDAVGWAFEPKLDGWRVLVSVDDRRLDVRTRRGRPVAAALPELEGLASVLHRGRVVLDGELVAGDGRPEAFYRLGARMAAHRPVIVARWASQVPLTLAVFDVLHLNGTDLMRRPYEARRAALEALELSGPAWCTVASFRVDGAAVLDACDRLGIEGVVAKRLRSWYWPGERSRDWVKVKTSAWRDQHAPRRHEQLVAR